MPDPAKRDPATRWVVEIHMYTVYILKSTLHDRYYVGHTNNIDKRLKKHNAGQVKSTKPFKPWTLIHYEQHQSRAEAFNREMEIKKYKSGIKFKKLLGLWKE